MGKQSVLDPALRKYSRPRLNRPVFEWGGVFEKWSRGFVKRNFWRVSALFLTEEDALQECAAIFLHCRNKYAGKLDEPKHLMALYQTALTRAWHTFASRDPHFRCVFMDDDTPSYDPEPTYNGGPLSVLLSQCDAELRALITAIAEAPSEFLGIIFGDDDTMRITNRVSRMYRIKAGKRDLVNELRELLENKPKVDFEKFAYDALALRSCA